jgi:diguanylate cyclase
MISGLFINFCILITTLYISSQFFRGAGFRPEANIKNRLILGILGGGLGVILMNYSIPIERDVVFDFRHIAQMMIAVYGGFASVVLSSIIMAVYRVFNFGAGSQAVISAAGILAIGCGCGLIKKLRVAKLKKWIVMSSYSAMIITILMIASVKDGRRLLEVLMELWIGATIIGGIVYYTMEYLSDFRNMVDRLKTESTVDFLTGLSNTRTFDYLFNRAMEEAEKASTGMALLIVDIDFFKKINDTYGHACGDMVLKDLAQLLQRSCRASDQVARIGGEEFAMIIRGTPREELKEVAERIRAQVENAVFHLPHQDIHLTISIGAAMYPDTVGTLACLKEEADNKLYEAKRTGRNKVCI